MDLSKFAGMLGDTSAISGLFGELEASLGQIQATGEAAAGQVRVTLNGRRDAIAVHVDTDLLETQNQSLVQDFVMAAINDAERKIEELIQNKQREYFMQNFGKIGSLLKR